MWEHVDLPSIILTCVFGVLFPWLFIAAWKISSRTLVLEEQHETFKDSLIIMQKEIVSLLLVPGEIEKLNQKCQMRCASENGARDRNDAAHERIESGLLQEHKENITRFDKLSQNIEAARKERSDQMKALEDRLVREFKKNGGGGK